MQGSSVYKIPNSIVRVGGIASIISGLLLMGLMLHPNGEEPIFGTDPFWAPAHGLVWISLTFALLAWFAIYIIQAERAGKFGVAAFSVVMIGTGLVSWIFSSDVVFVPVIAAKAPELFDEIFGGAHVLFGIPGVLLWILGLILFGISIIRAKIFPKWIGVLLIIGSLIIPTAYFVDLGVKVVATGAILIGISQIWLGFKVFSVLKERAAKE